jgi:hypothetical protein
LPSISKGKFLFRSSVLVAYITRRRRAGGLGWHYLKWKKEKLDRAAGLALGFTRPRAGNGDGPSRLRLRDNGKENKGSEVGQWAAVGLHTLKGTRLGGLRGLNEENKKRLGWLRKKAKRDGRDVGPAWEKWPQRFREMENLFLLSKPFIICKLLWIQIKFEIRMILIAI